MTVTVYTQPSCAQCEATLRQFGKQGIEVEQAALAQHPDVLESAKSKGHRSAPVVVLGNGEMWAGYRPDLIKKAAALVAA